MGGVRLYHKAECDWCHEVKFIAAKGLCRACYYRERRMGTLEHQPKRERSICCVEGCRNFVVTHGVCERHRVRDRKKHEPVPLSDTPTAVYLREWRKKRVLLSKAHDLRRDFGITLEQYQQMVEAQGGVCAICGETDKRIHRATGLPMNLAVDHCHDSKKIRGLLCGPCNHGIGNFRESPELMLKAIEYLKTHNGG